MAGKPSKDIDRDALALELRLLEAAARGAHETTAVGPYLEIQEYLRREDAGVTVEQAAFDAAAEAIDPEDNEIVANAVARELGLPKTASTDDLRAAAASATRTHRGSLASFVKRMATRKVLTPRESRAFRNLISRWGRIRTNWMRRSKTWDRDVVSNALSGPSRELFVHPAVRNLFRQTDAAPCARCGAPVAPGIDRTHVELAPGHLAPMCRQCASDSKL